jgi:hypothetical protein
VYLHLTKLLLPLLSSSSSSSSRKAMMLQPQLQLSLVMALMQQ